jgi:predicted TIM-barrel fold metal-dependent hydrolase
MSENGIGRRAFLKGASLAALGASAIVDALPGLAQDVVPNTGGTERPKLKAPKLACDCHHHIYDPRFPGKLPPTGPGKPIPDSTVADYRKLQHRIGTTRDVILTPGPYLTDNSVTLDAIAQIGPSARGIAIVTTDVTDAELKKLHDGGIRGIRFVNPHPGALTTVDMIEPLAKRVNDMGWHIDVNMAPALIADNEDLWNRVPTTIVFDHLAHMVPPAGVDSPGFMTIRRLMEKGKAYMKLSIFIADSKVGPPTYGDLGTAAKAYVKVNPERCIWGTNWPHPGEDPKPDDAGFLDLLLDWAPDAKTRHRILVENPEKLFGFPKSA